MRSRVSGATLDGKTNLALMAPIEHGLVDAYESISYVERLQRLLDALHASRRNQRESELLPRFFVDTIGRHGVIQTFRYAIWPPRQPGDPVGPSCTWYLTLNVTFDGGWEPYMRVIYDDIGPLLDALLCHCRGYPRSHDVDFDTYCRWVRDHELDAGTFYTDSAPTAADALYGERLLDAVLDAAPADAAMAAARCALPPLRQDIADHDQAAASDPLRALAVPLRTLRGLYRLAPFFDGRDTGVLQRFARLVLLEPLALAGSLLAQPAFRQYRAAFANELRWLTPPAQPAAAPALPPPDPAAPQQWMLTPTDAWTHGCMALLRVDAAVPAAATLAALADRCAARPADTQVAFTHRGLAALQLDPALLDAFAPEFIDGMEARSSILGDVHTNHPNAWRRPLRWQAAADSADRIDLSQVHAAVLLRLTDGEFVAHPLHDLHPDLESRAAALAGATTGLTLLALQPLHVRRQAAVAPGLADFDFKDGISQPLVPPLTANDPASDIVAPGELILGCETARDRQQQPAPRDALQQSGSYLAVRVLRQRVERLRPLLPTGAAERADALACMMGRSHDGHVRLAPAVEPTAGNAFDFAADPDGVHCPFQSHIRRSNPRDGRRYMPRILRRGMSYGSWSLDDDTAERGVVFMAYCASIAEQFETVQRWVAGGNSSGLSSALADPFLGVPVPGRKRWFRYFDAAGHPQRIDLGAAPLVELQWGLYLFVPAVDALSRLAGFRTATPAAATVAAPASLPLPAAGSVDDWRTLLDDRDLAPQVWAQVRAQPGSRLAAGAYGELRGARADVVAALGRGSDGALSVAGYGERMRNTIGLNYLGLDGAEHDAIAGVVNPLIQGITEEIAFSAALACTRRVLDGFRLLQQPRELPDGDDRVRRPVDLVTLSETVTATLCQAWFGLPDELPGTDPSSARFVGYGGSAVGDPTQDGVPRCPRDVYSSSRNTFNPHPKPVVDARAQDQGPRLLQAARDHLASAPTLTPLTKAIRDGLLALPSVQALPAQQRADVVAGNLAGLLLGFPPTVHGNLLQTFKTWIDRATLWDHQQALAAVRSPTGPTYAAVRAVLRPRLMQAMAAHPVPDMLWRCPVVGGQVDTRPEAGVVLGIGSALADAAATPGADDELMFGGSCKPTSDIFGVHACPGYGMGAGVLLGIIAGLLDAGTLRPTGSAVLLMLTPRKPAPAASQAAS